MKHKLLIYCSELLNIIFITAPFAVCWYMCYADEIKNPFFNKGNWLVVGLFAALYIMFCKLYSGLNISTSRMTEIVYSQSLAALLADCFMYIVISLLSSGFVSAWELAVTLLAQFGLSLLWTYVVHKIYFKKVKPMRSVFIWDMRENIDDFVKQYRLDKRFEVVGTINIAECLSDIDEAVRDIDAVFLCGIHSSDRSRIIKKCISSGISIYVIPRIGDVMMSGAECIHIFHVPMMVMQGYDPSPEYLLLKRLFDIVISALALIVASPLMLVVSVMIKSDGGTVFYKQKRLTKDRREFEVLKFRSMRMDAENDGVARLSSGSSDDRITPVGRFIQKVRIDELPQFINIIKGDMSIVGPRPERPEIAEQYEKELPEFALRLQAKAGLTGQAQVYGKYNTTPYDKLLMDLQYISKPSLFNDLKIIFATIKILFLHESTEGVKYDMITAADIIGKEDPLISEDIRLNGQGALRQ